MNILLANVFVDQVMMFPIGRSVQSGDNIKLRRLCNSRPGPK